MITNHPASTTVNEGEVAIFNCTATGRGDLTIEWDVDEIRYSMDNCSPSEICNRISNTNNTGGSVTSTLQITASLVTDFVACVMKQNLSSSASSFGLPMNDIEVRPPPIRTLRSVAQLTVIALPTTTQTETSPRPLATSSEDQSNEGGEKENNLEDRKTVSHRKNKGFHLIPSSNNLLFLVVLQL